MNNPENEHPTNPLESDGEFQMTLMNPNPSFRTTKNGDRYRIDFEISKEEWEWFTDPNIDRTGMVLELTGVVTHRNQKKGPNLGDPKIVVLSCGSNEIKPKGGQLSQEAGKMCSNTNYHEFLKDRYNPIWTLSGVVDGPSSWAAYCTRRLCGVASRADLDSQPTAKKRFMALMHEFSVWSLERA